MFRGIHCWRCRRLTQRLLSGVQMLSTHGHVLEKGPGGLDFLGAVLPTREFFDCFTKRWIDKNGFHGR